MTSHLTPRGSRGVYLRTALAFGLLCSSSLASLAYGQAAPEEAASPKKKPAKSGVEEVVVTAEKRTATVQSAALSITALSGAALQRQGISNIVQVAQETPGISLRSSGPGQTELEMRGMSSSGGSAPTVGFYLDETPLTPPAASLNGKVVIDPDLFDLNRVEVLRGPQGTLYGSGSMGGTIRLVTNQPNLELYEGNIDTTLSQTYNGGTNPTGKFMVNFPIVTDKVALRVVGEEKYVSGWTDRIVVSPFPTPIDPGPACAGWNGCVRGAVGNAPVTSEHNDVNWEWFQSLRASLLVKPIDDLTITTTAMYQRIKMGGYNDFDTVPGDSVLAHYQPYNVKEPFADTFKLVSNVISYNLDWATLTAATSYYSRDEVQTQDATEAIYNLFNYYDYGDTKYFPIGFEEEDRTNQISEEVRLASSGNGRFTWVVGGFYSHLNSTFIDTDESVTAAPYSYGGAAANPLGIVYNANNPYHVTQYAAFAEASYKVIPSVRFTVGLRYFDFDTQVNEQQEGIGTASGNAIPTLDSFTTTASGITPKFNVSWEPNGDLTVYATAAKGFRPGGVNLPIPNLGCLLTSEVYRPDTSWDYELGEKARMLDSRLTVNADIYYIQWSNIQQIINQPCGYPLTQNAGNAESYGPEAEISAKLTPTLTLTVNGAWTHARLTSVDPKLTAADPTLVAGDPILNVPKYTESTSITYKRPVSDSYDFIARVTNSFVGPSTDESFAYVQLPAYDIINFRTGLVGDKWSGFFFIDNLTNTHAELTANTTSFNWITPSLTRISTNLPLTFGVNLSYKF